MNLFVDTSVWLLALGRDAPSDVPEINTLVHALQSDGQVVTTGFVLQELLQGFSGPKARTQIIDRFSPIPLVVPDRQDHIEAAELRNHCRRHGIQTGMIDALFAQLCIRHRLPMLSTDRDFPSIAKHSELKLWRK